MNANDKLAIIQQILGEVSYEISTALTTDESSKFERKIEHNGKIYTIEQTRESFLEDTLISISERLENINFGHI
ncbi:hypothetical protein [Staphylococcus intermedius]|uniref:ORF065 n=1 Tax=Staphylococcus intermedius NCTC 11048 TaxID=1141106 RepID=A0A380GAC8_STAIN|nr:hypothetical protein [Staphylococcus intermedius]PCF85044.1 hypothetical protein B4W75_12570 [Staphylococcus intermedius]PNZ52459.1 hypothetical protein CD138_06465 [Staphylococcus intermedius NCTC 11048]SUM47702.1 ORF065 [Staphylococcus intermedius NCTC 11048]